MPANQQSDPFARLSPSPSAPYSKVLGAELFLAHIGRVWKIAELILAFC